MTEPLARTTVDRDAGAVTARIRGEIDVSNAAAIGQKIQSAAEGCDSLRVDLTEVSFIDSAGLRMLQHLERARDGARTRFSVTVQPDSTVRQLLEITALDRVITVEPEPG